jgi:magnesium-transporting ATPase (P-type)
VQLYDKRGSHSLTTLTFWKTGVLMGVWHGAVCFFIPYYSLATSGNNNITDVYSLGKVAFVALLGTVTLEVALVARYWTWLFGILTVLSYTLVYPYLVVFPLAGAPAARACAHAALGTDGLTTTQCTGWMAWFGYLTACPPPSLPAELWVGYYDPSNIGVSNEVLGSPTFWFVILVCYIITFGSRFLERTAAWAFKPQDTFILSEKVGKPACEAVMPGIAASGTPVCALVVVDWSLRNSLCPAVGAEGRPDDRAQRPHPQAPGGAGHGAAAQLGEVWPGRGAWR